MQSTGSPSPNKEQPEVASSIDAVLRELDAIIDTETAKNSYAGIFAYLYRRTTAQIKTGIEQGRFEHAERMVAFDIQFAGLYLDAYQRYQEGKPCPASWRICFESSDEPLTIIQHLMMGMSTHIRFDLGVAACMIMGDQPMQELRHDFMTVNDILFELVDEIQQRLGRASKLVRLIDQAGGQRDERFICFNMATARHASWHTALELAQLSGTSRQAFIDRLDQEVHGQNQLIKRPDALWMRMMLYLTSLWETKNVQRILIQLRQ